MLKGNEIRQLYLDYFKKQASAYNCRKLKPCAR